MILLLIIFGNTYELFIKTCQIFWWYMVCHENASRSSRKATAAKTVLVTKAQVPWLYAEPSRWPWPSTRIRNLLLVLHYVIHVPTETEPLLWVEQSCELFIDTRGRGRASNVCFYLWMSPSHRQTVNLTVRRSLKPRHNPDTRSNPAPDYNTKAPIIMVLQSNTLPY